MAHPFYREQLSFLLQAGREMAMALPSIADELAEVGADPDVERLLEGIAFIAGKISEKQNECLPELTQFLFDTLFPHYLSPVPATAIVEFKPDRDAPARTIPAGSEVHSVPVGGTACRFRTVYEVDVSPLRVGAVSWKPTGAGGDLTLCFIGHLLPPGIDRIRLFLSGEPVVTSSIYEWLLTRLESVDLIDLPDERVSPAPGIRVTPLGLTDDQPLLSYPEGAFSGYRLLQEYFALQQKFLFLDIEGVAEAVPPMTEGFCFCFHLKAEPPSGFVVGPSHFRLGCTPVVNLFEHSGDPVRRDPGKTDHFVRPAGPDRHHDIQRVLGVTGYHRLGTTPYPILSDLDQPESGDYAHVHRRLEGDRLCTYVSVFDAGGVPPFDDQTLLTDLLCSNGVLPLGLRAGDIQVPDPALQGVTCRNITAVTRPAAIPLGEEMRRRLIVHLSLSRGDPAGLEAIRQTVSLYNFHALENKQAAQAHRLIIGGILAVESEEIVGRHRHIPVRGRRTTAEMDEAAFGCPGELYLFGSILNEVIALQTPINCFSELVMRGLKSQSEYRWPRRLGRQRLDS
jgi:type VI secretion system protein ImpG